MTLQGYINNLLNQIHQMKRPSCNFSWRILRTDKQFSEWNGFMKQCFAYEDKKAALLHEISKIEEGDPQAVEQAVKKITEWRERFVKKETERRIRNIKESIRVKEQEIEELKRELNQLKENRP